MFKKDMQAIADLFGNHISECIFGFAGDGLDGMLLLHLPLRCPNLKRLVVDEGKRAARITNKMLLRIATSCPLLEELEIVGSGALSDAATVKLCKLCPNLTVLVLPNSYYNITYATMQAMLDNNLRMKQIYLDTITEEEEDIYKKAAEQKGLLPLPVFGGRYGF